MSIDLALEELRRADESLTAARICLGYGINPDSISRSYYAVFHAATAVLVSKGIRAKSHSALRQLFGLHIVQSGLAERRWGSMIGYLHTRRNSADYDVAKQFNASEAREAYNDAEAFVNRMRLLVGSNV